MPSDCRDSGACSDVVTIVEVPTARVTELAERVRDSRFTQDVIGPKVARPLAGWLQDTFADDDGPDGSQGVVPETPSALVEVAPIEVAPEPIETEAEPDTADTDDAVAEGNERPTSFVAVVKALMARIKNHNLVVVAAGIAFWGLLAIPAVLFSTVSIAGLVLDPETVTEEVEANLTGLPKEARTIIGEQLKTVSGGSTGGLITGLIVSLLLALWSSSGAMAKLMATMNTIYGTVEKRSFPKLRGLALALTFGGIVFVATAVFLLTVLPPLLGELDAVGSSAETLVDWLRFPALGLVMVIALGVLYHVGPDRRNGRYRLVTLGAVIATVLWVVLSGLFTFYASAMASYNETYGSLSGLVVLLLWLFITAFMVLIGAEIHALTGRETADPR